MEIGIMESERDVQTQTAPAGQKLAANDFKSLFGTNKELEEKGKWVAFAPGVEFLIARAGTPLFDKVSRKHFRPYRSLLQRGGEMPPEASIEVTSAIIADALLLNWRGVVNDGEVVPYTRENAMALLREYRDFRDWVWEQAGATVNFKDDEVGEVGKA